MIQAKLREPGARPYSKHGLNTLRRSLKYSGNALTSRRYNLGRLLWEWRQDCVDLLANATVELIQHRLVEPLQIPFVCGLRAFVRVWCCSPPLGTARTHGGRGRRSTPSHDLDVH